MPAVFHFLIFARQDHSLGCASCTLQSMTPWTIVGLRQPGDPPEWRWYLFAKCFPFGCTAWDAETAVKVAGATAKHCIVTAIGLLCIQVDTVFPRVRTPCGHSAQVIVEGREEQSDDGEKNKETQHHTKPTNTTTRGPQAVSPPSCSLSSVQGETCETKKSVKKGA